YLSQRTTTRETIDKTSGGPNLKLNRGLGGPLFICETAHCRQATASVTRVIRRIVECDFTIDSALVADSLWHINVAILIGEGRVCPLFRLPDPGSLTNRSGA